MPVADPMPPAETEISEALVKQLLTEQHPDLAGLELRFESEGWDSAIFRLGPQYAVRLSRRAINAALLPGELQWLPTLAPRLTLPVNAAIRTGQPGSGYPWPWSIGPWFEGASWADAPVADPIAAAATLGEFVRSLAADAPADAPVNPYRGGPLTDRDAALRQRVQALGDTIDAKAVLTLWDEALAAPVSPTRRWVHGDLHPANIIVRDGKLAAVIDWVDLCAGDVAYDLAAAWLCFEDRAARDTFVKATGLTGNALWLRARACAMSHAIACLASSADNPRMHAVGERSLAAALEKWV